MSLHPRSSRQHFGENTNPLSIITDRARPRDVLAVRGSTSPERDLDPTAPAFVNGQASARYRSVAPAVNRLPQGYQSSEHTPRATHSRTSSSGIDIPAPSYHPGEYRPNAAALPITAAPSQNMALSQPGHTSYGQNLAHLSAAMRLPRPAPVLFPGPTQSPLLLGPPRTAAVQYSPPHRPYHEPMTAIHVSKFDPTKMPSSRAEIRSSRADLLARRVDRLQELKKDNLSSFSDARKRLVALNQKIESLQLDGNDKLQELYESEFELVNTDRAQEVHGVMFTRLEAEIEEVMADLMVPHEAREEEECPDVPGA